MQELKTENEKDVTVTGELVADDTTTEISSRSPADVVVVPARTDIKVSSQRSTLLYLILPAIFLTVSLLGGLRLSGLDSSFVFLKPPLLCLIFAAIMIALFFRAGLIHLASWFSEDFSMLKNVANGAILLTLFGASTQIFNSLLPEQGLPFWVVGFCFFWTLWNNLFADFDTKKLLRSLGALFGLAFVAKYLLLANLAAPDGRTWFERLTENPGQEAMTWLLDLPRFAPGTGYIQFFAAALFLVGLFLLPSTIKDEGRVSRL